MGLQQMLIQRLLSRWEDGVPGFSEGKNWNLHDGQREFSESNILNTDLEKDLSSELFVVLYKT